MKSYFQHSQIDDGVKMDDRISLELGKVLKTSAAKNNNYLFIAFLAEEALITF